jgi:hypothetical protein
MTVRGESDPNACSKQQILELGPALDHLAHKPALRHDLQIEPSDLLEGTAHEMVAEAPTAKGHGHLGVVHGHDIASQAIVRNRMISSLVTVRTDEARVREAESILNAHNPVDAGNG